MVGQRFGQLTVIAPAGRDGNYNKRWLCKCDCGAERVARADRLKIASSCGSPERHPELFVTNYRHRAAGTNRKKRGGASPEYLVWSGMIQRCTNPRLPSWPNYGGRGITVCEDWRRSFSAFLAHAGPRPVVAGVRYTIDRINNDGNYEPGNIRWATYVEQSHNQRSRKPGLRRRARS